MSKLNEVLRNFLAVTQQGAVLPMALGGNKEFESSFSSSIHMLEREPERELDLHIPRKGFESKHIIWPPWTSVSVHEGSESDDLCGL